jgi:hypothetical protein
MFLLFSYNDVTVLLIFLLHIDFNVTAQVLDMGIVITWHHSRCSGQFATVRRGPELEVWGHLVHSIMIIIF